MHRIDTSTAKATLETPEPAGTPGYFTNGDPLAAEAPTIPSSDWFNAVQEELAGTILGAGLVLDKGDAGQLLKSIARLVASGSALGNVLTNPEFRFWQRNGPNAGNNPTADVAGYHGPDRWRFDAGQSGESGSLSRIRFATFGVESLSGAEYGLRWNKTTAAGPGAETSIAQRIERVSTLAGQKVVLAFDAAKNSGSDLTILGVDLTQNFGTGGSPSAAVVTPMTAQAGLTIDGTARRLVFVATLPSTVGKVLGSTSDYLEVKVKVAQAVTFDVILTAAVLGRGTVDPGWAPRHEVDELQRCRRHYQKSTILDSAPTVGFNETGVSWDFDWSNGGPDIRERVRLTTPLYRFGLVNATTYYANGVAGQVEEVTGAGGVYHAATMSPTFGTLEDLLGAPRLSSPPAGGTLRAFRFGWSVEAEL